MFKKSTDLDHTNTNKRNVSLKLFLKPSITQHHSTFRAPSATSLHYNNPFHYSCTLVGEYWLPNHTMSLLKLTWLRLLQSNFSSSVVICHPFTWIWENWTTVCLRKLRQPINPGQPRHGDGLTRAGGLSHVSLLKRLPEERLTRGCDLSGHPPAWAHLEFNTLHFVA